VRLQLKESEGVNMIEIIHFIYALWYTKYRMNTYVIPSEKRELAGLISTGNFSSMTSIAANLGPRRSFN
jgi:hypothetical protein